MATQRATTLKGKALQLLAMREYSRAEMHDKLLRWLRTQTVRAAQRAPNPSTRNRQMAVAESEAHATILRQTHHVAHRLNTRQDVEAPTGDAHASVDDAIASHALDAESGAEWLARQQDQITAVLDELQAKGWLDDRRTAEAILHQRGARFGQVRLRQVLQQKGIDADIGRGLLHDMADSEFERAQALWQKKFGSLPATPAERARQMRFLASRGFTAAMIHRILRHDPDDAA